MNITTERMPDSQVLLTIEVDPDRVEQSMQQAYRRVLPRVRVPGFRPGKAPRQVLERHLGREALLHEALEKLVPEVVDEAIKSQDLQMIEQPALEISSLDPVVIKATVPVRPTVDLGAYRDLRLEPEPAAVTDEQIDAAIHDLRRRYATIEPVERAVEEGDHVRANLRGEVDGREVFDDEDAELTVTAEALARVPGLHERLIGMAKGDSAEVETTLPEDYQPAEHAGHPARWHVTVLDVKAEVLPDLDDEFAKEVGEGFASMDALRERVTSDLRTRSEEEATRALQEKAMEALIAGATMEFPPQLVDRELDRMVEDFARQLGGNDRRQVDRYVQLIGRGETGMKSELRPGAEERVRRSLALSRLAELEGINVLPDEVEQELAQVVGSSPQAAQLRQIFDTESGREVLERQVLSRRTAERLLAIVRGEEPPLPQPAVPAQDADSDTETVSSPAATTDNQQETDAQS
ncbi:MAG: trigger factor [Dehalococcoidia bacterium]